MSLEQEIEKFKNKQGNVRGDIILGTFSYIKEKQGEQGVQLVKEKVKVLGFSDSLDKIIPLGWYSEALSVAIIICAKDLFKWTTDDIFKMGNASTKYSFVIKTIIKYFASLEDTFKGVSRNWEKYFDFGSLEIKDVDIKNKKASLVIKDYNFHPDICHYHRGFILKVAQLSLNKEEVNVEEIKCYFNNAPYHEYLISWK